MMEKKVSIQLLSQFRMYLPMKQIIVFVPFGFFKPMASKKRSFFGTVFDGAFLSLVVEVFQLLSKVGRFDVDDLILNTSGVILGYLIFVACNATRRRYGAKRKRT